MRPINALFSGALLSLAIQVTTGFSFEGVPREAIDTNSLFARAGESCPAGQYYNNGCKQCQGGYYCPDGKDPKQCDQGQYAGPGATSCTACPAGTYTNQKGSARCATVQCGWYGAGSNNGNNKGATEQKQCGKGFYSSAGSTSCEKCPAGSYCNSLTTCVPSLCQPGRFSDGGASDCTECPAGTYVNRSGSTSCCQCCAGSFQSSTGQTHCQACPEKTGPNGQGKVLVTSNPGSKNDQQCRAYQVGDPAPIPAVCVDSSVTQNQATCPATAGPVPTGLLKRSVPQGCSNWKHTMCEVKSGRGGWECIDTNATLDACGSCDNDCSAIPYVGDVKCIAGKCQVTTCRKGFSVQYADGVPSCVPTTKQAFMIFERDMNLAN